MAGPDETAPPPPPPLDEPPLSRPAAMTRSAFEDRSPRFLLGTIALAVVVALIAGFVIGYKVENSKGTTKAAKKAATGKKTGTRKPKPGKFQVKAAPLLVGGAYSVSAKQLVVLNSKGKGVKIGIGPNTKVAVSEAAKASDIVVGSKVMFQPSGSSATKATEVVILPKKSKLGSIVSAVVPGTSMTIRDISGKDHVITTTGATVEHAGAGTRRNIAKGDHLIVYYYVVRNKRNSAVMVVVLPAGTKFTQQATTQ